MRKKVLAAAVLMILLSSCIIHIGSGVLDEIPPTLDGTWTSNDGSQIHASLAEGNIWGTISGESFDVLGEARASGWYPRQYHDASYYGGREYVVQFGNKSIVFDYQLWGREAAVYFYNGTSRYMGCFQK